MRWRDRLWQTATNLVVAGPVAPGALADLPARFERWVLSPASRPYRFRRAADGRWMRVPGDPGTLGAAAAASVIRLPPGLDVAGLDAAARARSYDHFGVQLLVSGPLVGVSVSHAFSDGVAALVAVQGVLGGGGGVAAPAADDAPRARMSAFPTLRGLARSGQLTPSALSAGRALLHVEHPVLAAAPRVALAGEHPVVIRSFAVPSAGLAALGRAAAGPDGRKPPTTAVLASLLFRAVRRTLAPGVDLPIRMQVGLRRHLGPGVTTHGNFAFAPLVGTLRSRDWTPADYLAEVAPRVADERAIAAFAFQGLSLLRMRVRARVRGPRREASTQSGPLSFSFNVIPGGVGLPSSDYVPGAPQHPSLVMVTREGVLGPHLTVAATGREFVVTAVDDSGLLDIAALEAAVTEELARASV